MTVSIRRCTIGDIHDMVFLIEELGYPTKYEEMKERFNNIFSDSNYCTLIAEANGKVIGLVGLQKSFMYEKNGINVRIVAMVVHNKSRGNGVGRQLLLEAEKWAINQGASSISLNSGNRPEREAAHQFYQRMGFTPKSTGFTKLIV